MGIKKHIINIFLLICMIMCFGLSLGYYNNLNDKRSVTNFYLEDQQYTMENFSALKADEESINGYTAWKEYNNVALMNEDLGKNSTVKCLTICGNSALVVDSNKMLFQDDKIGCLIDKETAYDLFGSYNVEGNEIIYNNKKLKIRGIHKGEEHTIVVQADHTFKDNFNGITVDSKQNMETLSGVLGINNNGLNTGFYSTIAKLFLIVIPIMIIVPIVFKIIRKAIKEKSMPVRVVLYAILLFIITKIFFKIVNIRFSIPYDIIPNQWSDFNYWSSFFEDYIDKAKYILYMKKYTMDICYLNILFKCIITSLLSIVLFCILKKRIKIDSIKKFIIVIIGVFLLEFIVFVKFNTGDNIEVSGTMFWLLYPYYLILYNSKKVILSDFKLKKSEKQMIMESN